MKDKKLDEQMIKLLTFQLVSAVKALHSPINNKLVIHRDIKSDNILIKFEASGEVTLKLADFGSSKILEVGQRCSGDEGVTQSMLFRYFNKS
jgi:serine/threonine protein kinase